MVDRQFDEILLRRTFELCYENDIPDLPCALVVSNYLMSEDIGYMANSNIDLPISEGMNGSETKERLNMLPYLVVEQPVQCQAHTHYVPPATVVQLKTLTSVIAVDELLLSSSSEKLSVLQKILGCVGSIISRFMELYTSRNKNIQNVDFIRPTFLIGIQPKVSLKNLKDYFRSKDSLLAKSNCASYRSRWCQLISRM